ncbi:hypothetical protein BEP19_01255 [Ammoniphilus oxalaticus]|uniref:Glycosyl transferase family 4 n=1 Tax=Ammoniphilus oxalaticus TaxID=66863 RepID=A0A419SN05_9BACL|nr:hypothetical protein [Ammoniphilus oxalaticus]RKD25599.1 hypothetical protein BEP19_01255 [Ammoniphilus oxalaticus]
MVDTILMSSLLMAVGLWWLLSALYRPLISFLEKKGMVASNYEGAMIPLGVGVVIPFVYLLCIPWMILIGHGSASLYLLQTLFMFVIAYVGWRDDRFGGKQTKGIRGHLSLWWKTGERSTGLWKAAVGSWVALFVGGLYARGWWEWLLHAGLIALLINQINLLDLRPGRALKGFFIYALVLLPYSFGVMPLHLWLPLLVTAGFLFQKDIRAQAMLGDTGSNTLGFTLAMWIVVYGSLGLKLILFSISLLIQLYAEKKSISALIQRNAILSWIDGLGRRET